MIHHTHSIWLSVCDKYQQSICMSSHYLHDHHFARSTRQLSVGSLQRSRMIRWFLHGIWLGITHTVFRWSTQLRHTVALRASQYRIFTSNPTVPGNRFTPLLYPYQCFLYFRLLYHPDTVPSVILATYPPFMSTVSSYQDSHSRGLQYSDYSIHTSPLFPELIGLTLAWVTVLQHFKDHRP